MKTIFSSNIARIFLPILVSLLPMISYCQIPASTLVWKHASGGIYSAPLVVDQTVYIGDMKGEFAALDLATGEKKWSYQAADYIASSPAFKDGIVVFEAGDRLHGLDAQTGELLWSYKSTDKKPTAGFDTGYHHSCPVIEGNTAYYGDEWGHMNGVNIKTGNLDFQYQIPFTYTTASDYNIRSTPIIKDSIIYFGDYEANIYAIALKDKSEKWIHKMETPRWDGSIVSEMVIDNNVLYFGRYTNALIPISLETGEELWKFSDTETYLPSTPVFYKDDVIIGTTISSNHIYALKKATGEKSWELKVKGIFFNKPIIVDDSILVMNSTDPFVDHVGIMYFINLNKGKIINEIHLPNATEAYPVKVDDIIIIGKNDGLFAFQYKPLLGTPQPSSFIFDDSDESFNLKTNESLYKTFPLTNDGLFGDSVTIRYEREGDATKARIGLVDRTNYQMSQSQQLDISMIVKPNSLKPGDYLVKMHITSARQTGDYLFEKTVKLTVSSVTGTINPEVPDVLATANPNPFRDFVNFDLKSLSDSKVNLRICSLSGELVYSNSVSNSREPFIWNGCNNKKVPVKPGIYVFQLSSDQGNLTGKLIKN